MKTTDKSKNKNNKITETLTPNKNASAKSISQSKDIHKSASKSIERLNDSPQRKKVLMDHSRNLDFIFYVDTVTD